jgi:hypothetical protein
MLDRLYAVLRPNGRVLTPHVGVLPILRGCHPPVALTGSLRHCARAGYAKEPMSMLEVFPALDLLRTHHALRRRGDRDAGRGQRLVAASQP